MSDSQPAWKSSFVITRDHAQGKIIDALAAGQFLVRFDDGQQFVIPTSLLAYDRADSCYRLDLTLDELSGREQPNAVDTTAPHDETVPSNGEVVIPVAEEELTVGKESIVTGVVRVQKVVHEREEVVRQPLEREEVTVERVPVNRVIDAPEAIRYEGDTMIVPLIEEVLVVEKRLVIREELRITRRRSTEEHTETVTLRSEDVIVEREPSQDKT